jgi:hypothetical protein
MGGWHQPKQGQHREAEIRFERYKIPFNRGPDTKVGNENEVAHSGGGHGLDVFILYLVLLPDYEANAAKCQGETDPIWLNFRSEYTG